MDDLVSIIVPNYNHGVYLPRAIQSILSQEYRHFELLLIEDASTDQSREIIQEYSQQDSRIRIVQHEVNRGVFYSMNEGLEVARGKYIQFLGADDFYLPGFLSKSIALLKQHPTMGLSACESYFYFNQPDQRHIYPFTLNLKEHCLLKPKMVAQMLRRTFLKFSGTNCIAQTELVKNLGGFEAKFNASCDWLIFTKIALRFGAVYIPEPLVCWKKNNTGVSASILRDKKGRRAMYAHVMEDLAHSPKDLFQHFKTSGELGCVLKYAPVEFLKRPKFWSFLPAILSRYMSRQWKRRLSGFFQKRISDGKMSPNIRA